MKRDKFELTATSIFAFDVAREVAFEIAKQRNKGNVTLINREWKFARIFSRYQDTTRVIEVSGVLGESLAALAPVKIVIQVRTSEHPANACTWTARVTWRDQCCFLNWFGTARQIKGRIKLGSCEYA